MSLRARAAVVAGPVILFAVVSGFYVPAVRNGFIYDDKEVILAHRGITNAADFALAVAAFLLLFMWQTPPWLVVILSAAAGALVSLL